METNCSIFYIFGHYQPCFSRFKWTGAFGRHNKNSKIQIILSMNDPDKMKPVRCLFNTYFDNINQ